MGLVVAFGMAFVGQGIAAGVIGGGTLASLVGVFLHGSKKQSEDLSNKKISLPPKIDNEEEPR